MLPKGWTRKATEIQVAKVNNYGWGYGYQWWRIDNEDTEVWAGLGFGDQFLFIFPERNIIAIINSWNIFDVQREFIFRDFFKLLNKL